MLPEFAEPSLLPSFAKGFALSAALIIAIGAQNMFVLRQGLRREHVGPIVLFCGSADALLIAAGVAGLGAILTVIPGLGLVLTLGGAAFLGWYGISALRRASHAETMAVTVQPSLTLVRALAAAAAFTLLNPHVYLDTVLLMGAVGSSLPSGSRPVFVAGAATASYAWFAALGYGARLLTPVFARPVAWKLLDLAVGLTMLGLAGALVLRALHGA
ncbi:MAG: amino acid transporter [Hydrocarboniphaga sp.]|uniref:LysE/ArgO family amino acid transporter n=1 Tax=Hydrocarboniphaga sp. TaxID=2033016 RepID=UPI002633EB12|nr:LysE family transporter [Hydrocarboniphaga sp.]MDB5973103.1 amino acid transporter [Hydrocarboniphaga sp.]